MRNANTALQNSFFLIFALLISTVAAAQQDNDTEKIKKEANTYLNEAEEALSENDFAGAEASYRKAIAKDPSNTAAKYNMGNLYYNREKSGESQSRFVAANEVSESKEDRHRINHNLGNSFMKQKKYKEAVEAYKNALRNDPTDDETRYNLALAKKKLEEEQKQNQDQNNDQNKDNKDQDQDKKDQNKDQDGKPKDEGDNKKEDPKDGEGDQENEKPKDQDPNQQNQDKQDQKDQKGKPDQQKQQQPQPAQGQLSPQQIKSLLEAMNNQEEKVQDKINAEKAKGVKTRSDKDW